jgi:hypothetical protein
MAQRLGRVVLWAFSAALTAAILWVPLAGVGHALAAPRPNGVFVPFLFVLYAFPVGWRLIAYGTPVLALLFGAWALLCRRRPRWDEARPVALSALVLALAASGALAGTFASSWAAFAHLWPFYLLLVWGALALPRWLVPFLEPGAFS